MFPFRPPGKDCQTRKYKKQGEPQNEDRRVWSPRLDEWKD